MIDAASTKFDNDDKPVPIALYLPRIRNTTNITTIINAAATNEAGRKSIHVRNSVIDCFIFSNKVST